MKTSLIRRIVTFSMALVLVSGLSACGVNTIPTQDEQVKAAWSQVENQYKRRADLVPNLVNTVKGYASHEQQTLTAVIEARAKATSVTLNADKLDDPQAVKQFEQSQGQLTQALGKLMVVSEQYPNLKADQNFLSLQSQLEGTENRITVARKDYIAAVQQYNTTVRTFPGMIWAFIYKAKAKETFAAQPGAENAPAVQF